MLYRGFDNNSSAEITICKRLCNFQKLSISVIWSPNVESFATKVHVFTFLANLNTFRPLTVYAQLQHPLICKSGYFSEKLKESNEVELPPDFPGGPDTFEMIALFIYGSSTLVDPFNVASLRCAAEFLNMTEEFGGTGNLCERFDIYLNQVVLQSWNDTLIVLQNCLTLLPWAEDLLIVSRCIETLAFMACMEILDPERRREQPVVTMEALAAYRPWTDQTVKKIANKDLWINDLIALPFAFFKRVIGSLRRQGMKEKYCGKAAESDCLCAAFGSDCSTTPIGNNNIYVVAELWDLYLNQIADDSEIGCKRFMNLIETVPISSRQTHDHLYRALNTFFQFASAVQNETMPLRLIVQALFVQQLNTQQAFKECSDSFRYTTHCGGEHSGSLSSSRYANSKSQNLVESPYVNGSEGGSRPLGFLLQKDSSIRRPHDPLGSDISRMDYESTSFRIQNLEKELMSLKRSLQLQQKNSKKIEPVSGLFERRITKKKIPVGQVTSCIGTVNFASQRKYANRILKVIQRIRLFGRGDREKLRQGDFRLEFVDEVINVLADFLWLFLV
ncbi:hypothetical protein DH2020_022666 [Rehmannia glutinosa]|uniref:NPH3 domain-containing protein n=1 Tax=Rehmannia glutinosa TaxID=99300 RepID=A0ABR0W3S7_REHGL